MKNTVHIGKYIFPTHEKALEMLESLQSTEENPLLSYSRGFNQRKDCRCYGRNRSRVFR